MDVLVFSGLINSIRWVIPISFAGHTGRKTAPGYLYKLRGLLEINGDFPIDIKKILRMIISIK
jgi:hypothetical protein